MNIDLLLKLSNRIHLLISQLLFLIKILLPLTQLTELNKLNDNCN